MKKTLFIFVFLGALAGSYFGLTGAEKPKQETPEKVKVKNTAVTKSQTVTKTPIFEAPNRIVIDSLGVNAFVESVTVDSAGNMAVPKDFNNTAWYSLGPKPGEAGSAVIDGHVDTPTGAPAVFAGIGNLPVGSRIQTVDTKGETYNFEVISVQTYALSAIPLKKIFSTTGPAMLNLITCSGTWNKAERSYSHRTVVYSKLVKIEQTE